VKRAGSLVDTSVWIDFFRGVASIKELLTKLIIRDRVFTAGPVLFELLQGIRSSEERGQVKEALLSVNFLDITPEDWEGAALISRELRSQGITIPMTDLLLAQLAKVHDLEIISLDPHFDQIHGIAHRKLISPARFQSP
jgi:predicted nucleic acid-binding protein